MRGTIGKGIQKLGTMGKFPLHLLPFPSGLNHAQMKLLIEGFTRPNEKLKDTAFSVATVIGFMNLTDKLLKVQSPAISSGYVGKKAPWPSEVQPHSTGIFWTRKASFGAKGSVGTSIFGGLLLHIFHKPTYLLNSLYVLTNCFTYSF